MARAMADFREIDGNNGLKAYQSGAFGTPSHWIVGRHGQFVAATNSEIDARILMEVLATATDGEWTLATIAALRAMNEETADV